MYPTHCLDKGRIEPFVSSNFLNKGSTQLIPRLKNREK